MGRAASEEEGASLVVGGLRSVLPSEVMADIVRDGVVEHQGHVED
jgi:hypothetical protein